MKGQSGMETLLTLSIISIVLIISTLVYLERQREVEWLKDFLEAKKYCYKFSSMISRIRANGNGFTETFSFQDDATIKVYGDTKYISICIDDVSVLCPLLNTNVTNQTNQRFDILRGDYSVINENEEIVFQKK